MSKPSASGRRRNTVWIDGQGWVYVPDGKYHRHLIGGGHVTKAVTRARRAVAGRPLGHATGVARARAKALTQLMAVATQLETDTTQTDLVTPQRPNGVTATTVEAGATKEAA